MDNMKTALWDENSEGRTMVCPHCGGKDQKNTNPLFLHIKVFEHETMVKGLDEDGNLMISPYEYGQTGLGQTYIRCQGCGGNFTYNEGQTLVEDEMYNDEYSRYSINEDTYSYKEEGSYNTYTDVVEEGYSYDNWSCSDYSTYVTPTDTCNTKFTTLTEDDDIPF